MKQVLILVFLIFASTANAQTNPQIPGINQKNEATKIEKYTNLFDYRAIRDSVAENGFVVERRFKNSASRSPKSFLNSTSRGGVLCPPTRNSAIALCAALPKRRLASGATTKIFSSQEFWLLRSNTFTPVNKVGRFLRRIINLQTAAK